MSVRTLDTSVTRASIEDFLFEEAVLLDQWDLNTWLGYFQEDGVYNVPSMQVKDLGPGRSLYMISDDMARLRSRVGQLLGDTAWAENPRSRTRRFISNVQIVDADAKTVSVEANFQVYRFRHEEYLVYVGRYHHKLARTPDGYKFIERKAVLDLETLRNYGPVSIIV